MSDTPVPVLGPVYGWRTWDVDKGRTASRWVDDDSGGPALESRGGRWSEPQQEARCLESTGWRSIARYLYSTSVSEEPRERDDHEPASDPRCWCGLYAHSTLARCLDHREPQIRDGRVVLGLVRAWGRMFAADRGFRAQHMKVDTLVCAHLPLVSRSPKAYPFDDIEWTWRVHQPHVRKIARGLGVDVKCVKLSKRSLTRAFADREGVYLWRKEAPWISDVTPAPTRSSTPRFHTGGTVSTATRFEWSRSKQGGKSTIQQELERAEQQLARRWLGQTPDYVVEDETHGGAA